MAKISQEEARRRNQQKTKIGQSLGRSLTTDEATRAARGETIQDATLSPDEAARRDLLLRERLGRTKDVGPAAASADELAGGSPLQLQDLEKRRLEFQNRLLDATPAENAAAVEPQATISQPPNSLQNENQPQPAGEVSTPAAAALSGTDQIAAEAKQKVEKGATELTASIFDPLAGLSNAARKAVENAPEGTRREAFLKHIFKRTEELRQATKKGAENLVGIRVFGVGLATEREENLRETLLGARKVLDDNNVAIQDVITAYKAGDLTQDEAIAQFQLLVDQNLEMEQAVIAVSQDPLAFKFGDIERDLTNFRNWRTTRLPLQTTQLSGGIRI